MSIDLQGIGLAVVAADKSQGELEKLRKATDGFEALFLKKLFSQMRSTVTETQFGQTFGKEIYNDMFDEAMANAASKSKTLGLSDMLYNQFAPRIRERVAESLEAGRKASLRTESLKTEMHDQDGHGTHSQDVNATEKS
jgi:peptidoglycan hydrolase FlgJ